MFKRIFLRMCLIFGILLDTPQGLFVSSMEASIRSLKSEEILKNLNESADPCEDFYNFACGNWQRRNKATANEPQKSVLLNMAKDFDAELVKILEERREDENEIEAKVKDFYRSCLTKPKPTDEIYRNALKNIVNEFGSMPALEGDSWLESNFDWITTIGHIAFKYNIIIIMGYSYMPNPDNTTISRLVMGRQNFALPLTFYFDNTKESFWQERQSKICQDLRIYFDLDADLAERTAHDIMEFEVRLAKGANRDRYEMEEFLLQTTARRMHKKYAPDLNIESYLRAALGSMPWDYIFEKNQGYQQNLIEVIRTTPQKTVANYIFYTLANHFGSSELNCLQETKKHFLNLLENLWYRTHDVEAAQKAAFNLFEDLKTVFYSALASDRYKWIGKRVRRYSIEKLHALSIHFQTYEETNFTREYSQLSIDKGDYIGNLKSIYHHNALKSRAQLGEPTPPFYEPSNMPLVPQYIRNEHRIIVPLISLQSPVVWSFSFPNAVNLGQMGFLLAREILHAFDDESRFKDKLGNEADWWDIRSKVYFNDRSHCFLLQYQNYSYLDKPWPISPIQSENIADNGGISLIYETYRLWYEDMLRPQTNLHLEQLPSLSYKNKKLFFISYAQTLCSDTHPRYYPYLVARNTHLPDNLRVLGSLSNLPEFPLVFQCKSGSTMNPVNKCKIY